MNYDAMYDAYFDSLEEGEEALSYDDFVAALGGVQ